MAHKTVNGTLSLGSNAPFFCSFLSAGLETGCNDREPEKPSNKFQ